ncbi:MAG: phosphoglycerate kinase [Acidimicrobiia bacterium]|nr:phosphoglycerate kinase [Acidimicrobiia bacterium]
MAIPSIDDFDVAGKRVLLRVDINSPIDPASGKITDENRIDHSLATIRDLAERGARLVIIAHQGDTLDYHNLVGLNQHAERLAAKLGQPVGFIDDVAGPAARERIAALDDGDILLLDNLRYLTEEVSTFERDVKLTPEEMAGTYLVRNLAPLFDLYVNDAYAAAHRASPSMTAFQRLMPSGAGRLLFAELGAVGRLIADPPRPAVFVLGGLKVSDGFAVMGRVLGEGLADRVLTTGVVGEIMLMAAGVDPGAPTTTFIADRDLTRYVATSRELLAKFGDRIALPTDVAALVEGKRREMAVSALPSEWMLLDIGSETIAAYETEIAAAGSVFVNGPPGAYEKAGADVGTRRLWEAVAATPALTIIGGGDTVASAHRFVDTSRIDHVSTGGGALIRHVAGNRLPLLEAFGE